MSENITFFPVGNGDTTLFEFDDITILTDVNHRTSQTDDEDSYDISDDIQRACLIGDKNYRLKLFVLTHPDKDHLNGYSNLFYLGDPTKYESRNRDTEKLILVEEMWVSKYCENAKSQSDQSKPVLEEIKRRIKLAGTEEGKKVGNKIKVLDTESSYATGNFTSKITYKVLAPSPSEANISEENESCNDSSLVILWNLKKQAKESKILMGGDSTVEVWDRIYKDNKDHLRDLEHHILLAPHHCSRGAIARKNEEEKYVYSPNAKKVLGKFIGDGFVISSSKEIINNDDNPPSWEAKQKYLEMLEESYPYDHHSRFLNPDTKNGGKPEPVVFEIKESGLTLKSSAKKSKNISRPTNTQTYG